MTRQLFECLLSGVLIWITRVYDGHLWLSCYCFYNKSVFFYQGEEVDLLRIEERLKELDDKFESSTISKRTNALLQSLELF